MEGLGRVERFRACGSGIYGFRVYRVQGCMLEMLLKNLRVYVRIEN